VGVTIAATTLVTIAEILTPGVGAAVLGRRPVVVGAETKN